jgi:4-hydroxy-tetrahydrodipicolinate synthase
VTPVLTPFNDDGSVAEDLYFEHCQHVLAEGSDYISPFGTSGEALSISLSERRNLLEKIIAQDIARPDQIMPGTGLCALGDTLDLTKHAVELGCAAVMTLPPFFFPNPGNDGLFRYFSNLIEAVGSDDLKICLYHIPQNAGVGISPELAHKLNEAFPQTVVAYKDSSGNWENTQSVIKSAPGVSVFPASEVLIPNATDLGAGGCISATCNVNVAQIKRVFQAAVAKDHKTIEAEMPSLNKLRLAVQAAGLIPALKSMKAHMTGDQRWLNTRAPFLNADAAVGEELARLQ